MNGIILRAIFVTKAVILSTLGVAKGIFKTQKNMGGYSTVMTLENIYVQNV